MAPTSAKKTAFRGIGWLTWKAISRFGVGFAKRKVAERHDRSDPTPADDGTATTRR